MRNGFDTLLQTVQNDYGYDLSFALQDTAGIPLDIANATLTFKAQLESDYPVKFENSMVVINSGSGQCKYTVQSTDFIIAGTWSIQIKVTYTAGEVLTFSNISMVVEPALPL